MGRKQTDEVKFYVTLSVPKWRMDEDNWNDTEDAITAHLDRLAYSLSGEVKDLEIK